MAEQEKIAVGDVLAALEKMLRWPQPKPSPSRREMEERERILAGQKVSLESPARVPVPHVHSNEEHEAWLKMLEEQKKRLLAGLLPERGTPEDQI